MEHCLVRATLDGYRTCASPQHRGRGRGGRLGRGVGRWRKGRNGAAEAQRLYAPSEF